MQQHKRLPNMINFTYFTSQINLNKGKEIAPQRPPGPPPPSFT